MDSLYIQTGFDTSRIITRNYSTSFFSAVNLLDKSIRNAVFSIYGFVRLADEIVDSFGQYDRDLLLTRFEKEYAEAAACGISTNPVINAFLSTVCTYNIDSGLIEAFLKSMRADLSRHVYTEKKDIEVYIYGSAATVGLMCLKVFTEQDVYLYEVLREPAMKLGSAFQKVNFLRDMKADMESLHRIYFPGITRENFTESQKQQIVAEIEKEFAEAYEGICRLPSNSRLAVYMAYLYYSRLLKKIKKTPAHRLIAQRIRIPNFNKALLFSRSLLLNKINLI